MKHGLGLIRYYGIPAVVASNTVINKTTLYVSLGAVDHEVIPICLISIT